MGGKTPSNASGRLRTLVVGVNWLGDTVMTLPALAALRRDFEHEVFHVTVHHALSPLIPLALDVDAVLPWTSEDSLRDRIRMVKRGFYDRAVLFPNSFRSAWIVWRSRIPERWGYYGAVAGVDAEQARCEVPSAPRRSPIGTLPGNRPADGLVGRTSSSNSPVDPERRGPLGRKPDRFSKEGSKKREDGADRRAVSGGRVRACKAMGPRTVRSKRRKF